ncbi:AMP-binding protein [Nocardia sp. NPDC127526]|uniref:AMP-binding protein n=1 Tax=Nocardia sp. NPDC127526 TaxID=3345393 RepID=UPI00363B5C9E
MSLASAPTVTCGDLVRTQAEVLERAGRLAAALVGAGIGRGDRVAIMARNSIEFLEISLAAANCGANPVPVNTRWQAREVAHVLADAGVRVIFAQAEFLPVVEAAVADVAVRPTVVDFSMMEEWIEGRRESLGHVEGAIADSLGLIYTSGTTGAPKGVVRERMSAEQVLGIAGATAQRMGLGPGVRMLVAGPLYHTSPNAVAVLGLRMGADIVIMPRFSGEEFLRLIDRHRIQQVKVVPTMLSRVQSLPAEIRGRYDISSLTHVIHSAAPCAPSVKRAAISMFGDALWEFYGCSEAGTITWISAAEWLEHPGSVGRPVDGSAVLIADEDGKPLPVGEVGRVYVRGADYWPAFTYLGQGAPDSPVAGMIWVGDIGRVDADGWLYLTGRSSEIIIRGGVNIYPAEVENALMAVDGVEDAAVFAIPDAGDLGEAVAAHIVARPGSEISDDTMRGALTGRLADYKIPTTIRIVDALPRDDSGKINKRQLRSLYTSEYVD